MRWYDHSTGKRVSRAKSFPTRSAAQRFHADRRATTARGAWLILPLGGLTERCLRGMDRRPARRGAPRMVASYTSVWDTFLRQTLDSRHVGIITRAGLTGRIRDVSTVRSAQLTRHVHQVLSLVPDAAVEQRLLGSNVAKGIPLPRIVREQAVALDVTEVEALADAVDDRSADLVRSSPTAARGGEAVAPRRRDGSIVVIARASRESHRKDQLWAAPVQAATSCPERLGLRPMIARRSDAAEERDAFNFTAPDAARAATATGVACPVGTRRLLRLAAPASAHTTQDDPLGEVETGPDLR